MNVCMTSNIYSVLKRFYETSTSNEVSCFQCNWHCVVWIINKYKTLIWSLFYLVKLTFSNQITPMLKLGTASPKWKRAKNLPERSGKSLNTHLFYPSWFFYFTDFLVLHCGLSIWMSTTYSHFRQDLNIKVHEKWAWKVSQLRKCHSFSWNKWSTKVINTCLHIISLQDD